jgi:phospholipid-binding lipoprotein MlaA
MSLIRPIQILFAAAVLTGCATSPHRDDPFEPVNRRIYQFNEAFDKTVAAPVARVYRTVLPQFARTSVGNFFSNLRDVRSVVNNTLQGKFTDAYTDFGRVAINSTLGILGLFDIASEAGIEKHDEDFGQTLGRWGVAPGPFVMLPILGPSTVRDAAALIVDHKTDPVSHVDPSRSQNQITAARFVNRRAELLDASNVLHQAALDEYEFVRDGYLQRRRNLVYDAEYRFSR